MNPPNEESTPEEPLVAIVDLDEGPRGPLLWLRVAVVLITHNWITFCGGILAITGVVLIVSATAIEFFGIVDSLYIGFVVFLVGLAFFIMGKRLILLGTRVYMRKFSDPD